MGRVIIGMDPHSREKVLGQGRFGPDREGCTAMPGLGRWHKDRVWAVEGCNGIGRHIARRPVVGGETVLDVPAKLSARARLFDTAPGRKTARPTRTASPSQCCGPAASARSWPSTAPSR